MTRHVRTALRYALSRNKPSLEQAIMRDRDLAMADYLLDTQADTWDAMHLGRSLMWAAVAAPANPQGWLEIVRKIAAHDQAAAICPTMVQQAILQTAQLHDHAMARFLFSLPQVARISKRGWDDIMMETLHKGHPYKRVIERRAFEDRDGDAEIQAMVDDVLARQKAARRKTSPAVKPS